MGYYVDMRVEIKIPKKNIEKCLAAINALHASKDVMKKNNAGGVGLKDIHYSWVDNPPEGGWTEITKAFEKWRYSVKIETDGNVSIVYFTGEKLGNDDVLFNAIAPFVAKDSFVECHGEDDCHWKYVFVKGKCKQLLGQIIYN